jgi:pimeloyl-ACP methyl ester carboxylesterase
VLRIDRVMADVEQSLRTTLSDLPVLTLFGRKNDPYGWQRRFQEIFPQAAAVGIAGRHHFPFSDDPQAYAAAICTWWTQQVAAAPDRTTPAAHSSAESRRSQST